MRSAQTTYAIRSGGQILGLLAFIVSLERRSVRGMVVGAIVFVVCGIAALMLKCPRCGESIIKPVVWMPRAECRKCGLDADASWPIDKARRQ
jgi:hypothetical protein